MSRIDEFAERMSKQIYNSRNLMSRIDYVCTIINHLKSTIVEI